MIDDYKSFLDPSCFNSIQMLEMDREENSEVVEKSKLNAQTFFSKVNQYCEDLQNSEGYITNYHAIFDSINELGNIYQIENVISEMVRPQICSSDGQQRSIFYYLIDSLDFYAPCIFNILHNMISCSFDNLLLLLQNNLMDALFYGMKSKDLKIIFQAFNCFSMMLSKDFQGIENSTITIALIVSTKVIELMYNKSKKEDFDDNVIHSFIYFFDLFVEHLPPDSIRSQANHEKFTFFFNEFVRGCEKNDYFNYEIFEDFIFNGISISQDSLLYKIIHKSLCYASKSTNINIINDFCWIIYYLLKRDITTYVTVFELKFLAYADEWINLPKNKDILESLSLIIGQLFSKPPAVIELPEIEIEQLSQMALYIFDCSSNFNDVDFEIKTVCAFGNSILFNGNKFDANVIDEKRIKRIIGNVNQSCFRLSRAYCYLYLAIASIIDDISLILDKDVILKINDFLYKGEGNFVTFTLYQLYYIFSKLNQKDDYRFIELFTNLDGDEILSNLMDSEDNNVSNLAERIYNKYFLNKLDEDE